MKKDTENYLILYLLLEYMKPSRSFNFVWYNKSKIYCIY